MSRRIYLRLYLIGLAVLASAQVAGAQAYGQYSPYSIYGVGELSRPGTSYNRTMGGVGIAGRDNRFLNIMNPAAVTARDSLSVMMDFSLYSDNKIFAQKDLRSAFNAANIGSLAISFPIWRSSAMMFGITPYSGTGYGYGYSYTDPSVIGHTGSIDFAASGQGAVYQAFAAAGVTFFNRLSLGAQFNYNFGTVNKSSVSSFSDTQYSGIHHGQSMILRGTSGKFGLQYEHPLGGNNVIGVGATYTMSTKLQGFLTEQSYSTGAVVDTLLNRKDTLTLSNSKVRLASEIGIGVSYRKTDRFMVEFDYTLSDWRQAGFENYSVFRGNSTSAQGISSFSPALSQAFRLGMEFIPNRNDIRYYFNKVAYRAGAYYRQDYFKVDGHDINSYGITLGMSLPLNKRYNAISLGLELGRRGTTSGNLISENYINFSFGANIFDIWFEKPKYR